MNIKEKLLFLEEIMDVDEGTISEDELLNDLGSWDSMSVIGFMTEMRVQYGINLTTEQLRTAQTVGDLCAMIPDSDV